MEDEKKFLIDHYNCFGSLSCSEDSVCPLIEDCLERFVGNVIFWGKMKELK